MVFLAMRACGMLCKIPEGGAAHSSPSYARGDPLCRSCYLLQRRAEANKLRERLQLV